MHFDQPLRKIEGTIKDMAKRKKLRKSKSGLKTDDDFASDMHRRAFRVLHHSLFEGTFGIIILVNLVLVIIETDAVAKNNDMPEWVNVAGVLILAIFVMELGLRVYVLGWDFWTDGHNVFDFMLVTGDCLLNILGLFGGKLFPVAFLRIVRLSKLARVSKAFRVFPELRLMMGGLLGSLKAIFWGTVLLTFAVLVGAILAVQFIHPLNEQVAASGAYGDCERCSRAYRSVFDSSLTLIQHLVAGDSWGTTSIEIIEYAPWTAFFYAYAFMSIGMAILNLILGVVVDVASQARDKLRSEIEDEKLVELMQMHSQLLDICNDMDADGNGELTRDELFTGYANNTRFQGVLNEMDISEEDLDILWTCLDEDKSGTISYTEFVATCYKLKSSSTHFMLAYIKYYICKIKDKICMAVEAVKEEVKKEERMLEEELEEVLREEGRILEAEKELQEDIQRGNSSEAICKERASSPKVRGKAPPSVGGVQSEQDGRDDIVEAKAFPDQVRDLAALMVDNINLDLHASNLESSDDAEGKSPETCFQPNTGGSYVKQMQNTNQAELMAILNEINQKLDIHGGYASSVVPAMAGERRPSPLPLPCYSQAPRTWLPEPCCSQAS